MTDESAGGRGPLLVVPVDGTGRGVGRNSYWGPGSGLASLPVPLH